MAENSLSNFQSFDNHRVLIPENCIRSQRPRICVICMASYRTGIFFGQWIEATQDVEIIYREINSMLSRSPVEKAHEWAIYAYEGFASLLLSQYEDIELIHQRAVFITFYGNWSSAVLDYYDDDLALAEEAMASHYRGKFGNELDFATRLLDMESGVAIPEHIKLYLDYNAFRKDIFQNDYISFEADMGVHVFSNFKDRTTDPVMGIG